MISAAYCVQMAQYNAWQNAQLTPFLEAATPEDLTLDRGAFFGSIFGTLNHLLWGDIIWMSRFDGGEGPAVEPEENTRLTPDLAAWIDLRTRTDSRITDWAVALTDYDLAGALHWVSGLLGKEMTMPLALCVTHFFNHQTHHRGQVHAMLTATGSKAPVSDLVFMPQEA